MRFNCVDVFSFKCPSRFWMMMMMVVVVMMTPNELISLHLLKMMLNFPSCLSTINGESIRTCSMVFAWKLSQESTQSPGARTKTEMQAPIAGPG